MSFRFFIAALAIAVLAASAPVFAQRDTMTISPPPIAHQAPAPVVRPRYPYPYPLLSPPVRPSYTRCEQDRLLTDTTPCGPETAEAQVVEETRDAKVVIVPKTAKRCEQDRLLSDATPCEPR